jgi:transcriptional regulator with XRE-family HTH domain
MLSKGGDIMKNNIKTLREAKGIIQSELARLMNVSAPTITYWERNEKQPRMDKAEELADILESNVSYLLGLSSIPSLVEMDYSDQVDFNELLKEGVDVHYTIKSKGEYKVLKNLSALTSEQMNELGSLLDLYSLRLFESKLASDTNAQSIKEQSLLNDLRELKSKYFKSKSI